MTKWSSCVSQQFQKSVLTNYKNVRCSGGNGKFSKKLTFAHDALIPDESVLGHTNKTIDRYDIWEYKFYKFWLSSSDARISAHPQSYHNHHMKLFKDDRQ